MNTIRSKKSTSWLGGLAILTGVLAAGCAVHRAYLVPAPTANLTNGGRSATATADGITVSVTPNSWQGRPRDLNTKLTPLKVRIENHSKQAIRIAFQDFQLEGSGGRIFAALPPSEISGTAYVSENRFPGAYYFADPPRDRNDRRGGERGEHRGPRHRGARLEITPGFLWSGFYYAPYWNYGYVGISPWNTFWDPDMDYYRTYYPAMRAVQLPTRSMLQKGIPAGVIEPGGYVEGFLYFAKIDPRVTNLEFTAKLQGATSGRQFGKVRIPLQVNTTRG